MKQVADGASEAIIPAALLWPITTACEHALDLYEGFPKLLRQASAAHCSHQWQACEADAPPYKQPRGASGTVVGGLFVGHCSRKAIGISGFEDLTPLLKMQHEAKKGLCE